MLEAEEKLEAAIRARKAGDRDQRQRLVWIGVTAASGAVDTLFLALFAVAVGFDKLLGRRNPA